MAVRHSVFVLGNAGTGKSQVEIYSLKNCESKCSIYFCKICQISGIYLFHRS